MATGNRPYFNSTAPKFSFVSASVQDPSTMQFDFTNSALTEPHPVLRLLASDQKATEPEAASAALKLQDEFTSDIAENVSFLVGGDYTDTPLVSGKFLRAVWQFNGGLFGKNITEDTTYEVQAPA